MPERDGYLPGVPCWVDTSQPDPAAAVAFYGELFGWEFEDVMAPESEGRYFTARIRGGDVAAVGSVPAGAPPQAMWNTYVSVQSADDTATKVRECRRQRPDGAVRRDGCRPDGRVRRPGGGGVLRVAGQSAQGRAGRQRARQPELQRPQHPRRRRRQGLLWRGVRLADDRAGRRLRDVDAARLRRRARARQSGSAQADGGGRRARRLRGRRRGARPDRGRRGRSRALERDVRRRRRRRHRRQGRGARRHGGRRTRSTLRGCG